MLQSCVYMAAMGASGLRTVASLCNDKAHYAAARIAEIPGFKVLTKTFFKEFLVTTPKPAAVINASLAKRASWLVFLYRAMTLPAAPNSLSA